MRKAGITALALALMFAAPARAEGSDATPQVQGYLDRAEAFWADRSAHLSCLPTVEWADMNGEDVAVASRLFCDVWIDPVVWQAERSPRRRCLFIVHEYGHLLGLHHSADGIMADPPSWHPTKWCWFGRRSPYLGK